MIRKTSLVLFLTLAPLLSQAPSRQALILPLKCSTGDCPLLNGSPQTSGMRSGFVRLQPGNSVGWHSTGQNEESLVILHGAGEAIVERTTGTQDQRATTGVHPTGKTPQRHKYRQRTPRIRVRRGTSQLEPLSANVVAGSMFRSRPPAHTWLSNCYRQTRAISLAIQTAIQTVCVLWEHAILSAKGMLGTTREFRRGRGLLAVCLAAFFSLASLVPIAAQSLNDASGDMPCCKTKGKCCCRKNRNANSSRGPSIAATGCSDCGTVDLGSVSAKGNVPVRLLVLTPVVDAAITVAVATVLPPSRTFAHSLRQRPPPPEPLA